MVVWIGKDCWDKIMSFKAQMEHTEKMKGLLYQLESYGKLYQNIEENAFPGSMELYYNKHIKFHIHIVDLTDIGFYEYENEIDLLQHISCYRIMMKTQN